MHSVRLAIVMLAMVAFSLGGPAVAGTLLVANKSDHTLNLIDPKTGKILATIPTGKHPHEAAVSPDGRLAVVADYGNRQNPGSTLTVVDLASATVSGIIDLGEHRWPHGLAWLPKGRVAVTTEGSRSLLVVDPAKGEIVQAIKTDQNVSHMVAATPDGLRAFVANIGSGSVTVIDLESGTKIRDVSTGDGAEGIAVSPDGKEVWVTNRSAGTLSVLDSDSLAVLATIESPGFPIRIGFTPDGKRALVSCAMSAEIAAFDTEKREEVVRRKLDFGAVADVEGRVFAGGKGPVPVGLLVTPDGKRAYVAATNADLVAVVNPTSLEVVGTLKAGREPDGMAYVK